MTSVQLMAATADDCRFVYDVNNHPSVRARSIHSSDIAFVDHQDWFARRLSSPNSRLWVAYVERPIGTVRLDIDGDVGTLSIALIPDARGQGHGKRLLTLAVETSFAIRRVVTLLAYIRPDNIASRRAFEAVGFERFDRIEQHGVSLDVFRVQP